MMPAAREFLNFGRIRAGGAAVRLGIRMAVILFVSAAALLLRQSPMRTGPAVMGLKGPPPIPSKQFVSLLSPSNLTAVLEAAAEDEVARAQWPVPSRGRRS